MLIDKYVVLNLTDIHADFGFPLSLLQNLKLKISTKIWHTKTLNYIFQEGMQGNCTSVCS